MINATLKYEATAICSYLHQVQHSDTIFQKNKNTHKNHTQVNMIRQKKKKAVALIFWMNILPPATVDASFFKLLKLSVPSWFRMPGNISVISVRANNQQMKTTFMCDRICGHKHSLLHTLLQQTFKRDIQDIYSTHLNLLLSLS